MQVTAPDGRTWTVRRRWLPRYEGRGLKARWARRPGRRRDRPADGGSGWLDLFAWVPTGDGPLWFAGVVLVVFLVSALFLWGVPLVLALIDLVVVLVVLVAGVLGRVVLRRPWTVEATTEGQRLTEEVVGWRRAGEAVERLADDLRHGRGGQQPRAHGTGVLP